MADSPDDITILLRRWHQGDHAAGEEIFRLLMGDLKRIAARCLRRENLMSNRKHTHTLQRTELVDEGFIRLAEANRVVDWRDRNHFFAICTIKLGYVLIEHARKRPKADFISLEDLPEGIMAGRSRMEVHMAIHRLLKELEKESPIICAVVVAKNYVGYEEKEIAKNLGLPLRTVQRHWHDGRKWLFERLSKL